jgi:hypothetical protein
MRRLFRAYRLAGPGAEAASALVGDCDAVTIAIQPFPFPPAF